MTNLFYYTDSFESGSSLVDEAYFDEQTNRVLVDLNDELYIYGGISRARWDEFKDADSHGRYYGQNIKREYGPGQHVGSYGDVTYRKREKTVVSAPVSGLTLAPDANVASEKVSLSSQNNQVSLSSDGSAKFGSIEQSLTYTVVFNGDKKYTPSNVSSVDEAVAALSDVAKALGVDVKVKGVFVSFE